jgi:hypothetical protein
MDRLMCEIPELVILYKPKRAFPSGVSMPETISEILEKNEKTPRWINLSPNANPWLSILLADLTISIPFTSTNLGALNKGKPFLYYNPSHYVKEHFYDDLNNYITHSYDALREKVIAIKNQEILFDELQNTGFYVPEPKGGFTQGFVNFLRNPEQEFTPKSEFIH